MWYTIVIVAGTIVCGTSNSILTKFQDNQCVRNCNDIDPSKHILFEQPAIQTLQMFIGEMCIYSVYYTLYKSPFSKRQGYTQPEADATPSTPYRRLVLAIPSVCDMLATSLMNIGLVYTPVSIYQMTRGAVVLFVAFFSTLFLGRHIKRHEWIALVFVTFGVALVGYSGSGASSDQRNPELVPFGISLILVAVALQATQFVIEEKILSHFLLTPLELVYTEGFFGVVILMTMMLMLNFTVQCFESKEQFLRSAFNLGESLSQTFSLKYIIESSLFIMICISCFNFCGISLTHHLSATSRSTVDSCRTTLVWLIAMILGWEKFDVIQFIGFVILVYGTLWFNRVVHPEKLSWFPLVLRGEDPTPLGA